MLLLVACRMGPSSSDGVCVLGVGLSFVLDDIVSYNKTLIFPPLITILS